MSDFYWIIEYGMQFLSDFHVGAGLTLMGGHLHGLRLDQDGWPYLPDTQVRGLMRLGGRKLMEWQKSSLKKYYLANFADGDKKDDPRWSYTQARYPTAEVLLSGEAADRRSVQSHVRIDEDSGIAENLFFYQKGAVLGDQLPLIGRIYSLEPATEEDVAFLVACMRAEDRVGHRRSRGYGQVVWEPRQISRYQAGEDPRLVERPLAEWLALILNQGGCGQ